jgi:hypothetical protein
MTYRDAALSPRPVFFDGAALIGRLPQRPAAILEA